jgi:hypothetical protein
MSKRDIFSSIFAKVLLYFGFVVAVGFLVLVVWRGFYLAQADKTAAVVAKIHATKLTLDDVNGKNLPPDPGAEADKTVQGIDANSNGIRDDVELAIFKSYPDSAKTRAVLLQYALMLQLQMTLPIVNKETVTATVEDNETRALNCIWSISSRSNLSKFTKETEENENFVKSRQYNNDSRKKAEHNFYEGNLGSYTASRGGCDLDLSKL